MKQFLKKIIIFILQKEAHLVLKKYNPKIVVVVGSVGKTTTKDAVYAVLAKTFYVRKSEKSFNSEIGIPLTVLGCDNGWSSPLVWIKIFLKGLGLILFKNHYPEWLVLEVGVDRPGDIDNIKKWLDVDIIVVSRFAKIPVHVEFFESPEAVIKEKKKILSALKKGGYLILNYDDKDVMSLKKETEEQVISFGFENGADIRCSDDSIFYENEIPSGVNFKINYGGKSIPVKISGVLGRQHIYPALAGIAVGIAQNINIVSASQVLSDDYEKQSGRMRIIDGLKNSIIIDDTYNSSPVAVEEALNTLREIKTRGRKIAVLGDMLELGKYSSEEHKKIGKLAGEVCDVLLTVGLRARNMATGALMTRLDEERIFQFEDSKEAGAYLQNIINEGDIILVKGSQSIRMERAVEEIMRYPERKKDLLVRQEEEWTVR